MSAQDLTSYLLTYSLSRCLANVERRNWTKSIGFNLGEGTQVMKSALASDVSSHLTVRPVSARTKAAL